EATLNDNYPDAQDAFFYSDFQPSQRTKGVLQQVDLTAIYNHPSGFFAEGEALWSGQSNQGYTPDEPGDDFWQFNLYAGYHFLRRKGEISVGLLNVTGQDYNLNPLNIYNELPRSRTLAVSLQFNF
ncbi:MAG TPA: hypothetical protein VMA13_11720, partial [Candidatus Saccharimonadales bacterium]|nr:hypothetical protein [Candidatus Saccharimonadales bacterium]